MNKKIFWTFPILIPVLLYFYLTGDNVEKCLYGNKPWIEMSKRTGSKWFQYSPPIRCWKEPLNYLDHQQIAVALQEGKRDHPERLWKVENGNIRYSLHSRHMFFWQNAYLNAIRPISLNILSFFESVSNNLNIGIASNCSNLADRVIKASEEKSASSGGVFVEYGKPTEVLKTNNSIVCKVVFKTKGELPFGEYTISQDNSGIYWKYSSGLTNQILNLPEVQILQGFNE